MFGNKTSPLTLIERVYNQFSFKQKVVLLPENSR